MELRTAPEEDGDARKESILWELVELLAETGEVRNANKLFLDLRNRERKSTTAIGEGIAIPHVRTRHARQFTVVLGRSTPGLDFEAPDGGKVHIFLCMVSPPYEDRVYLRVFRKVAEMFSGTDLVKRLLEASNEHELIRVLEAAGSR
jgi:mannitol/fructose-specific phosphotransferase system IIA component (Ntr-type)